MSARVLVLCPGCGGDWSLERPRAADLVTEEECECGTVLHLALDGRLTVFQPRGRQATTPVLPDDPGARPRSTAELLADQHKRLRALEQLRALERTS